MINEELLELTSEEFKVAVVEIERVIKQARKNYSRKIEISYEVSDEQNIDDEKIVSFDVTISLDDDSSMDFFFFSYVINTNTIQIDTMDSELETYVSRFANQFAEQAKDDFISGLSYKLAVLDWKLDN